MNMIQLIRDGTYILSETKAQHKMLYLDNKQAYAWIQIHNGFYEILVTAHKVEKGDHILATGKYRLYDVRNEANLTPLNHLELLVGNGIWQGYLLPTGLPTIEKKKTRIIPTKEIITKIIYHATSDDSTRWPIYKQ